MEGSRQLSIVSDGQYFQVISVEQIGKVKASCMTSVSEGAGATKEVSGNLNATSNFITHLKVN